MTTISLRDVKKRLDALENEKESILCLCFLFVEQCSDKAVLAEILELLQSSDDDLIIPIDAYVRAKLDFIND